MTTKIYTVAHVPPELAQAWLQHLRNFDISNPGCHFEVGVDDLPDETMSTMIDRLRVEPELTFGAIFQRTRWEKQ